jgi:hypothetical protein
MISLSGTGFTDNSLECEVLRVVESGHVFDVVLLMGCYLEDC